MPNFDQDIEPSDYVDSCNRYEIDELLDALEVGGYLSKSVRRTKEDPGRSVAESEFQEALDKLYNKWNMLSSEEEQAILQISKRF